VTQPENRKLDKAPADSDGASSRLFKTFLRVYGVLTLAIFGLLLPGFIAQSPLLAEHGGSLNWAIWNDVRCGADGDLHRVGSVSPAGVAKSRGL
jgi:hypothetical protein